MAPLKPLRIPQAVKDELRVMFIAKHARGSGERHQVDGNHAVWPRLDMELEVPTASQRSLSASSVGPCPSDRICLFSGYSLGGTMLSFGTCGIHTVPSTFSARSLAHARATGYTQARNGTTVIATAYAGGWANIYSTATNIRCVF